MKRRGFLNKLGLLGITLAVMPTISSASIFSKVKYSL